MLKQPVIRTVMAISLGAIAGALCRYSPTQTH
jgi:CrcB protein